jgi:hypothetical protein
MQSRNTDRNISIGERFCSLMKLVSKMKHKVTENFARLLSNHKIMLMDAHVTHVKYQYID